MKEFLLKFFSRKFITFQQVMIAVVAAPIYFKNAGVSDTVTMTVLGIISLAGGAYGVINYKDAKLDKLPGILMDKAQEVLGQKTEVKTEVTVTEEPPAA